MFIYSSHLCDCRKNCSLGPRPGNNDSSSNPNFNHTNLLVLLLLRVHDFVVQTPLLFRDHHFSQSAFFRRLSLNPLLYVVFFNSSRLNGHCGGIGILKQKHVKDLTQDVKSKSLWKLLEESGFIQRAFILQDTEKKGTALLCSKSDARFL